MEVLLIACFRSFHNDKLFCSHPNVNVMNINKTCLLLELSVQFRHITALDRAKWIDWLIPRKIWSVSSFSAWKILLVPGNKKVIPKVDWVCQVDDTIQRNFYESKWCHSVGSLKKKVFMSFSCLQPPPLNFPLKKLLHLHYFFPLSQRALVPNMYPAVKLHPMLQF